MKKPKPLPPHDFVALGFKDPTARFLRITTTQQPEGRAFVDGVMVIPELPVCRLRMKTDAERINRNGPGKRALIGYVRAALHEDVIAELPWN